MTAPLPERIERALGFYRAAYYVRCNCRCRARRCEHEAAFGQTNAVLGAAIRDALAVAREAALEEAAKALDHEAQGHYAMGDDVCGPTYEASALVVRALATPDRSPA